eukprot:scaffold133670_cov35-Tisochrysis_lutea.AAC.3
MICREILARVEVQEANGGSKEGRREAEQHAAQHAFDERINSSLCRILGDEDKRVLARDTEVGAIDGDVDIRVRRDELNSLLQAPDGAHGTPEEQFDEVPLLHASLLGRGMHGVEQEADDLDRGDDGGAEGQGAHVARCHRPRRIEYLR